jgi:putative transposase
MARVPRYLQLARDAAYHVMSRGHNREGLLAHPDDKRHFLALLARYRQRFGFRLFQYCLLDNHVHVLLHLDDLRRLSALRAGLLLAYVRYFNRRYGFVGHLWQGRFRSPLVQRQCYWLSCGRYIERNPVEAGLIAQPWDYRWSSCRHYSLGETDALVATDPDYLELSPDPEPRQQRWREFVVGEDVREAVIQKGEWAVGDDDFRRRMAPVLARPLPLRRGRPRKEMAVKG